MNGDRGESPANWPEYALPYGTIIHGFTLERFLGSGGFGVTYLARDALKQPFAIKEYFPRDFASRRGLAVTAASSGDVELFKDCLNRFEREARSLVRLSNSPLMNDGIVDVVTYFEANGTAFLVMKYVEGVNLQLVLKEQPTGLSAERVSSLLSQLLSSVDAVHRAGLFHRDIKPANIMLRGDGRAVLIDFGSSREATVNPNLPPTQIFTPGYSPFEQMVGEPQEAFSDIYAIGAVCYHAIGGKVVSSLIRHGNVAMGQPDPLPPAERIGAGRYPISLLRAIDASLAIDPKRRPKNAPAMLAILEADKPGHDDRVEVAPTKPAGQADRTWNKPLIVAGGLAILTVALLLAYGPATRHLLFGSSWRPLETARPPETAPVAALPQLPNPVIAPPADVLTPAASASGQGDNRSSTPVPQATGPNKPEIATELASEQTILNHDFTATDPEPTVYRFEPNQDILVLDFATLGDQGRMLNRVAALIEKKLPHDRVLNDSELGAAIKAGGDTVDTFNYAHDYSAESLARFFAFADRDNLQLSEKEETLRRLVRQQGWLEPGARGGLVSLPRTGADSNVTHAARATMLLHQLSLAEYFTNAAYHSVVHRFWTQTLGVSECDRIRRYLDNLGYDSTLDDAMENEAQAYLMFTWSLEYFKPNMIGMSGVRLAELRAGFFKSMPAGWLRQRLGQLMKGGNTEAVSRH